MSTRMCDEYFLEVAQSQDGSRLNALKQTVSPSVFCTEAYNRILERQLHVPPIIEHPVSHSH